MKTLRQAVIDELMDANGNFRFAPHAPYLMIDVILGVVKEHSKERREAEGEVEMKTPLAWYMTAQKSKLDVSVKEIAESIGIGEQSVREWLSGVRMVPKPHWPKLVKLGFTDIERACLGTRLFLAVES